MNGNRSIPAAGRFVRGPVFALFLASGFSSLVLEVLWLRMLTPVFGVTAYALGTVLGSFMGGLALGSFLFGRFIDRRSRPLRFYALLEGGIGLYALAVPFLLGLAERAYQAAWAGPGTGGLWALRTVLSVLILIVPTTMMGATLPILCKFFIASLDSVGRETGRLYFINTTGAVLGTATAGFLLIPSLGLRGSTFLASGICFAVALIGLWLDRVHATITPPLAEEPGPVRETLSPDRAETIWILMAFGLSGFLALVFEVIWSRVLIMIFGSTVYSFSAMLSVFLLGLALGGALFGSIADRLRDPFRTFAWLQVGIGFVILAEIAAINWLPFLFLKVLTAAGFTYGSLTLVKFGLSAAILFPATLLFGGTFPLVSKLYTDRLAQTGRRIGTVYAINTVGAIAGSLVGGFVFLEWFGMRGTLAFVAALAVGLGGATLLIPTIRTPPRRAAAVAAIALAALALVFLPAWNHELLALGVYFQPKNYFDPEGNINLRSVLFETENVYYAEGLNDTIIVNQNPMERVLSVNGKIVASSGDEDMLIQMMLGHLPVLVHGGLPSEAMNIGLGTGTSLGALAAHPSIVRLDCIELETRVQAAARLFADENNRVQDDPKLNMIIADGRNYLSLTDRTYDIISSDPFHPYMTGAGNLYAREHFENGLRHLKPGGIMSQWLPLYQLSDREFRSVVATFRAVFPHMTVWFSGTSVILLGSNEPFRFDLPLMRTKIENESVRPLLDAYGMGSPERVLSFLLADRGSLAGYVEGAPINTDVNPFVEYSSPRSIFLVSTGLNLGAMEPFFLSPEHVLDRVDAVPADWNRERAVDLIEARRIGIGGVLDHYANRPELALEKLAAASVISEDPIIVHWLASANELAALGAQRAGDIERAIRHFETTLTLRPDRVTSLANLGHLYFSQGRMADAYDALARAYQIHPANPTILLRFGAVLDALDRSAEAEQLFRTALEIEPRSARALGLYGVHRLQLGDAAGAIALFRRSLKRDPSNVGARELLARTMIDEGRLEEADPECRTLLETNAALGQLCLGALALERDDLETARDSLTLAAKLQPGNPEVHFRLARLHSRLSQPGVAASALQRAVDLGGRRYLERATGDALLRDIVPPG